MSTYLIDFENVKSSGLAGIEYIRKEDSVHLFWSKRENKITIEMMELIRKSESEIVMHKAVTGERDALDHQLCSYLGYLAGGTGETDFVIVSNDKAYDHLVEFWKKMNHSVRIRRVSEISRISEMLKNSEDLKAPDASKTSDMLKNSEKSKALDHVSASESVSQAPLAEKAELVENTGAAEMEKEDVYAENRSGRNFRRRERGGKYLKGGRASRNNWRSMSSEEHAETHASEHTEEFFEKNVTKAVEEDAREHFAADKKAKPEITAAEPAAPAAVVVTGIKTGIIVESGFTADGVLDRRTTESERREEKKQELFIEEKSDSAPEEKSAESKEGVFEEREDASEKTLAANLIETAAHNAGKIAEETVQAEAAEKTVVSAKQETKSEKTDALAKQESNAEKMVDSEKKTKPQAVHTAGRPRRGRPPKKDRIEHVPEVKVPATVADVIAKCEDAANADWAEEMVKLINNSRDKKELYAATVKLLGQEKGRTVYHKIKVLK